MKLSIKPLDLSGLVLSDEQGMTRTKGVHVSGIIKHILQTSGLQKENNFTEDDLQDFANVGRLWERILSETLYPPPRYERVGELEMDGIIGSPDALDTQDMADVEMKVTWVSSRDFVNRQKFREYLWQVKSYCRYLGTCRAVIPVLHINGDYRPPKPQALKYTLLFTPQEIKENWQMMIRNKETL